MSNVGYDTIKALIVVMILLRVVYAILCLNDNDKDDNFPKWL
jgi:hypothetical protein